jgi:HSP20 family protein
MTFVKTQNQGTKSFQGIVDELFNGLPLVMGKTTNQDVYGFPPVNIVEMPNAYHLEVSAPGLEKANFNIKLEGDLLTITGNKNEETVNEAAKTIRKEFNHKSFKRSFSVDEKIDAEAISAKYENGILKVALPKKETMKEVAKEITIQ